jgi:predicted nucleic acid-binding protein
MIVLDASAAIELLLRGAVRRRLVSRIFASGEPLAAPHLLDLEVAQVLRRYVAAGKIDAARAAEALADFGDVRIARYPHDVLLPRIWELRRNCTAYDASYLALAESREYLRCGVLCFGFARARCRSSSTRSSGGSTLRSTACLKPPPTCAPGRTAVFHRRERPRRPRGPRRAELLQEPRASLALLCPARLLGEGRVEGARNDAHLRSHDTSRR